MKLRVNGDDFDETELDVRSDLRGPGARSPVKHSSVHSRLDSANDRIPTCFEIAFNQPIVKFCKFALDSNADLKIEFVSASRWFLKIGTFRASGKPTFVSDSSMWLILVTLE